MYVTAYSNSIIKYMLQVIHGIETFWDLPYITEIILWRCFSCSKNSVKILVFGMPIIVSCTCCTFVQGNLTKIRKREIITFNTAGINLLNKEWEIPATYPVSLWTVPVIKSHMIEWTWTCTCIEFAHVIFLSSVPTGHTNSSVLFWDSADKQIAAFSKKWLQMTKFHSPTKWDKPCCIH